MLANAFLTAVLLVPVLSAKPIAVTVKDCGTASTHGHFATYTTDPPSPVTGVTIKVTGSGSVDEDVTGGTFEAKVKAVGMQLSDKTGPVCGEDTTWDVKFMGVKVAHVTYHGMSCPVTKGDTSIHYDMSVSNVLPPGLGDSDVTITAKDPNGEDLLCVQMHLAISSDEDVEEHATRYRRGYKRQPWPANEELRVANLTKEDIANAPDAIDWSAKGATSKVNDQGDCGSCWAFSTTEGVESAVFMSTGKLPVKLSTQELVSCEKQDAGCDGGDIPEAVSYLKKNGMASESDYPDTSSRSGRTGRCTWNKQSVVQVTGMQYAIPQCNKRDCSGQDENALAAALAKYGPLSICVNSGDGQPGDWAKYRGGILTKSCKANANKMDHCVQLVGYDKTASQPYWKVRNSWNTNWGEAGYIRLPFGKENTCCVGCEAVIISATNSAPSDLVV